jgi:hypothetical protein
MVSAILFADIQSCFLPVQPFQNGMIELVTPGHHSDRLKINHYMEKEQISDILFF